MDRLSMLVTCLLIVAGIDTSDGLEVFNDDTKPEVSNEVVGDELRSLGQPQRRNPKDITIVTVPVNLGNIFDKQLCNVSGAPTGICRNEVKCGQERGIVNPNASPCGFLQGACCEYHHGCGESSGQRIVHWKTPNTEPGTCTFTLHPADNICYVKVEFLDLNLESPPQLKCMANFFYVLNMQEGHGSLFCGSLTNYEMYLKVENRQVFKLFPNAVPLKFFINRKVSPFKFYIRLTQISCDQVNGLITGGRKKREVSERIMASTSETATREGRRKNPNKFKLPNLSLHQTPAPKPNNNRERQQCPDVNRRPFDFPYKNIFTHIVEEKLKKHGGLFLPTRVAPPNTITNITTEFPWMGYLLYQTYPKEEGFVMVAICGAVLISETIALTAAHCVTKRGGTKDKFELKVRFGRTHLGSKNNNTIVDTTELYHVDPLTVTVRRVVVHAMYDSVTFQYDVALLELDSVIPFSPIQLPNANENYDERKGKIIGWGLSDINQGISPFPSFLEVTILKNEKCEKEYKDIDKAYSYTLNYIHKDMVCYDSKKSHAGACQGDSGGPLVVKETSGSYTLVGILSTVYFSCVTKGGIGGIIGELPDVSLRVSEVLDFINVATSKL